MKIEGSSGSGMENLSQSGTTDQGAPTGNPTPPAYNQNVQRMLPVPGW